MPVAQNARHIDAAIDLVQMSPEGSVLDVPPLVQRLAYPAYYPDLVLAESQSYALDPLLFFSLIRQESFFDAQVASWAGAVGLTQIMPSTGAWIAEMTAWPGYAPAQLERADINLKFGAWFLARLLDQAGGDNPGILPGRPLGTAKGYCLDGLELAGRRGAVALVVLIGWWGYRRERDLPFSQLESVEMLEACEPLARMLGREFVRIYCAVKRAEHEQFMRVIDLMTYEGFAVLRTPWPFLHATEAHRSNAPVSDGRSTGSIPPPGQDRCPGMNRELRERDRCHHALRRGART